MMPEGIERYACGKLQQGCMEYTRTHYADNCIFRPELPLFAGEHNFHVIFPPCVRYQTEYYVAQEQYHP